MKNKYSNLVARADSPSSGGRIRHFGLCIFGRGRGFRGPGRLSNNVHRHRDQETWVPTSVALSPKRVARLREPWRPGSNVAHQAYGDFLLGYAALGSVPCDVNLTGQSLIGQSLVPGVYCFDVAVTETGGVLTLVGSPTDSWVFKIGTSGTGALTGTNFSVVMPGGQLCNDNVFWLSADAVTLTNSVFVGSIMAGRGLTVTGGSLDGQAFAKGAVTLTGTSVCGPRHRIS
jgi:hypothetical protein